MTLSTRRDMSSELSPPGQLDGEFENFLMNQIQHNDDSLPSPPDTPVPIFSTNLISSQTLVISVVPFADFFSYYMFRKFVFIE